MALAKHGLSPSVLDEFVQMRDQFDAAVAPGSDGRTAHVVATREVKAVASEIVRTVQVMDGRNRQRFTDQEQLPGSWISASTVLGTPRPESGGRDVGRQGGEACRVRGRRDRTEGPA